MTVPSSNLPVPAFAAPATPGTAPPLCVILTPQQARAVLGFLRRASLSGREVPAFNEVYNLVSRAKPLPSTANPGPLPAPTPSSPIIPPDGEE